MRFIIPLGRWGYLPCWNTSTYEMVHCMDSLRPADTDTSTYEMVHCMDSLRPADTDTSTYEMVHCMDSLRPVLT